MRAGQLGQSLYGDEVWTYRDVVGRGLGSLIREVHTGGENSPPLFFVLAWLSAKLGDPSVLIRLPSLLFGAVTVPLVYAVGKQTFGAGGGLMGAAMLALSPFSLYYGIEARPYATMAFFVVLSTWALLHATQTGDWRWWLLYSLAAACAAYSHYTAVFVLVAQGGWSLWASWASRDRMREPLLAGALAALLYLPWLAHVRGKSLQVIGFLHPLTAHNVLIDLGRLVPGYPDAALSSVPTLPVLSAFGACVVASGMWWLRGALARPVSLRGRVTRERTRALIVLMAAATPVGLLLYSLLGTDIWLARGMYESVPYACLIVAAIIMGLPRRPRAAAAAIVLVTLAFGSIRAISPAYARPQYQEVASYLDRATGEREPIIAVGLLPLALRVYLHEPHPLVNTTHFVWRTIPRGARAWLLTEQDVLTRLLPPQQPPPAGFSLIAYRHYSGIAPITVSGYQRHA